MWRSAKARRGLSSHSAIRNADQRHSSARGHPRLLRKTPRRNIQMARISPSEYCAWTNVRFLRLADLLMSLPADQRRSPASATSPVFHTSTPARRRVSDGFDLLAEAAESQYIENEYDGDEEDVVGFCQQLFDNREFERCALKLDKCRGSKAMFLNMYAKYLASRASLVCVRKLNGPHRVVNDAL